MTTIGSELSYDIEKKEYDSKLELIFNEEPRVWTFSFFDDLSTRLNLQWVLSQRCKASLSTGIDAEEVFKGNLKLFPFGFSLDLDLGPIDESSEQAQDSENNPSE